jgi:hypothetical protein
MELTVSTSVNTMSPVAVYMPSAFVMNAVAAGPAVCSAAEWESGTQYAPVSQPASAMHAHGVPAHSRYGRPLGRAAAHAGLVVLGLRGGEHYGPQLGRGESVGAPAVSGGSRAGSRGGTGSRRAQRVTQLCGSHAHGRVALYSCYAAGQVVAGGGGGFVEQAFTRHARVTPGGVLLHPLSRVGCRMRCFTCNMNRSTRSGDSEP